MQTYQTRRKTPGRGPQPQQGQEISKSEMLHLSGAGAPQPISPALREKFEPGFHADFSNIRISRGHIPEEMGVQAVAQGTDILLDQSAGMDVLGHELAHVVQQAQGRVDGGYPVVENAALEHEADVMGQRVASGLTAQAGSQNGFGGEMMSIAPMSSASAPAQCKSREEKKMEKTQISEPTLLQPGTAGYQNSALDKEHLSAAQKQGSSSEDVALTQMLNAMHDSEYLAKVTQSTGSTPEEIKAQMGSLVGQNYAKGAKRKGIERGGDAINGVFRENALFNKNLNLLLQGDFTDLVGQMAQNAQSGTLEQRASAAGKRSQAGEMDQNTVDSQFDLVTDALTQSAPAMSVVDSFFREMKQTGTNVSDDLMEEKMSSELFLRGVNPKLFNLAAKQTGEEKTKTLALSRGLQTEAGAAGKAEHRNFLRGRASPQAATAPEPNSTQEMLARMERAIINRAIPPELFDEMTDERGNLLDAATIASSANAAFPANGDEMRSLFDPKTMPRREARAANQAAEEESFYNSMQSMFDDEAEELEMNLPHAPVEGNEEGIFSGLGHIDGPEEDEDEDEVVARMQQQSAAPIRDFERPSYMKYVDSLPMDAVIGGQVKSKKKHWWQFWK